RTLLVAPSNASHGPPAAPVGVGCLHTLCIRAAGPEHQDNLERHGFFVEGSIHLSGSRCTKAVARTANLVHFRSVALKWLRGLVGRPASRRKSRRFWLRQKGFDMIRFYYHPTPNPAKIALFLEETGLPYEVVPVDTSKGQQHIAEFRAINPNGKVPAIVDTAGPGGAEVRVFDSTAILLYLAEKTGQLLGSPADRGELLSWLFYIATGLGPFSGQAVHFQRAAPEKLPY